MTAAGCPIPLIVRDMERVRVRAGDPLVVHSSFGSLARMDDEGRGQVAETVAPIVKAAHALRDRRAVR